MINAMTFSTLQFYGEYLKVSELEIVLEIETDNKLYFKNHIKSLCSKASQKLEEVQRITNLLDKQNLGNRVCQRALRVMTCSKLNL